jgi:serine/threonine-protein kinase
MIPLGPFALEKPVGSGGMGQVWRGTHVRSGTPVAAKLVVAGHADLPLAASSVRREARAIAGLQHPHVVYVYDQGILDAATAERLDGVPAGSPWIVMELLTGGTLAERHADSDWSHVREDLERILEALAHCHARGILHRDLKPSNVLVGAPRDARPGLKLVDFGIAWSRRHGDEVQLGTPEYCAPEQLGNESHAQGPWSDVYALGALGWTLVTGEPPFQGLAGAPLFMAKASAAFRPFAPRIDVPDALEDWLQRCMAGPPGDRFQCAPDALHALAALGSIARPARPRTPIGRDAEVTRAMVGGSGLAARDRGAPEPAPLVRELIDVPIPPPALRDAGLGLWRHRPPQFTGRMPQRVRLWQRLEHTVRDGTIALASLRGPPGSGRTRTARWLLEAARVNGGIHGFAVTGHPERPALTDLVDQVLRGLPHHPEGLTDAQWMLEHHGITYRTTVDAVERWFANPDDEDALFRLAVQLVQSLARTRPVVLVLDDLDQCPRLRALAREIGQGPTAPILVVATAVEALPAPFVEVPHLDPLRQREMSQVLASVLPLSVASTATLVAGSGGLPGRALDLARQADAEGRLTHGPGGLVVDLEPEPPASLPPLPPPLRRLLERAALLGVFPARRIVTGSFGNRRRAERALDHLAERGLLETDAGVVAFAPGVRKAVLADASAPWTLHHLALARALPPESPEGALHRVRGGEAPEGFVQLAQALEALQRGGELHRLLAYAQRGLDTWRDAGLPPEEGTWVALVEHRLQALAGLRSRRLEDQVEADLQAAWDHGVWGAVSILLLTRASFARVQASRDLHFALEVAHTEAQRRRVLNGLARQAEWEGDVPRARYWLALAGADVPPQDRAAVVQARVARSRLAAMEGRFGAAYTEVDAAIRQQPVPGELDLLAAGIQLAMGEVIGARSSLLRGVGWMTVRRDRRWLPTALVRLGLVELLEGSPDQCEARLAEADRIRAENRRRFGSDPSLGAPVRLVLCLERGEWFRAMEALGHCPPVAWQRPTRTAVMTRVRELLEVRRDVPAPVREGLEHALVEFAALRQSWFTRNLPSG